MTDGADRGPEVAHIAPGRSREAAPPSIQAGFAGMGNDMADQYNGMAVGSLPPFGDDTIFPEGTTFPLAPEHSLAELLESAGERAEAIHGLLDRMSGADDRAAGRAAGRGDLPQSGLIQSAREVEMQIASAVVRLEAIEKKLGGNLGR